MKIPFLPQFPLILEFTPLALTFSVMVFIAAFFILLYSLGYMQKEDGKKRFYFFMLLFVIGMELFIFSGDWLLLITAWELISVASYFLIGFYQTDTAIKAGNRAFITTRTADTGLLLGILLLFSLTGSITISTTLNATGTLAALAAFLIAIAGLAKAAQVPFDGWLRDAMAGPTPVSALLHSATLVAAGVLLIIKIFPLFPPPLLLFIGIVGALTALIAGLTALTQPDLKRMLAASTSAQLGLMLVAIGAGSPAAAILHLIANAAMKSTLFLGAGFFQHRRERTEFSLLRGVGKSEKFVFAAFVIAGLALTGIPPLSGFFSKDAIIAAIFASPFRLVLAPFIFAASVLTGMYISRSLRLLWFGEGKEQSFTGRSFMKTGIIGLSLFILLFFLFLKPLEGLLGLASETSLPIMFIGLTIGVLGLGLGLIWKEQDLPQTMLALAQNGLRISSGLDESVVNTTFRLVNVLSRVEEVLIALPDRIGTLALRQSASFSAVEARLDHTVFGMGSANLTFASLCYTHPESFTDNCIAYLVKGVKTLGSFGARLQTGLIHQEMAYALYATGFIVVLYLVFSLV